MTVDPLKPYNDLPELPPNVELETKPVLKLCAEARAAIEGLRMAGKLIPDQSVLINTIALLEAKDSSEIENIVTTNDALFREASLPDISASPETKEAARYRSALNAGANSLKERPITTRTAVDICSAIMGVEMDVRETPGTALQNSFTRETIYTPPEGAHLLRDKLGNWERALNEDSDVDPLIRMAVLHYQFEAIHPFTDGNGRTGRIINLLFLIQSGLLDIPTLYLSRYILRNKGDYYQLLANVTFHREWEGWAIFMLTAIVTTASWTIGRITAIEQLMEHTSHHVKFYARKAYSHELIQTIFAQPYVRISHLAESTGVTKETASLHLKHLAKIGVLEEEKVGRNKFFVHRKYMDLMGRDDHEFEPYPEIEETKKPAKKRARRRRKT